ncbi:hypothetical protein PG984_003258 [Apiospora sp. TS-2023a]
MVTCITQSEYGQSYLPYGDQPAPPRQETNPVSWFPNSDRNVHTYGTVTDAAMEPTARRLGREPWSKAGMCDAEGGASRNGYAKHPEQRSSGVPIVLEDIISIMRWLDIGVNVGVRMRLGWYWGSLHMYQM